MSSTLFPPNMPEDPIQTPASPVSVSPPDVGEVAKDTTQDKGARVLHLVLQRGYGEHRGHQTAASVKRTTPPIASCEKNSLAAGDVSPRDPTTSVESEAGQEKVIAPGGDEEDEDIVLFLSSDATSNGEQSPIGHAEGSLNALPSQYPLDISRESSPTRSPSFVELVSTHSL